MFFFFDGSTGVRLGGLFQNDSVTQANFIDMLNIVLVIVPRLSTMPCPLTVKSRSRKLYHKPVNPQDLGITISMPLIVVGTMMAEAKSRKYLANLDRPHQTK